MVFITSPDCIYALPLSPLYHNGLWEEKIQSTIQIVDLLNLFVWNVLIDQLLSLFRRLNFKLLAEGIDVILSF